MILTPELYQRVVAVVHQLLERGEDVTYDVSDELGVSRDAVVSIYQQAFVKRQKRLTPVVEAKLGRIVQVISPLISGADGFAMIFANYCRMWKTGGQYTTLRGSSASRLINWLRW